MAILPLPEGPRQSQTTRMFVVYCPRHRSRILLFSDNIEALSKRPVGIELHWKCTCGERGVTHIQRTEAQPLLEGAT